METVNTISQSTLILSILGSTVVATIVGFVLGWVKECFQRRSRWKKEQEHNLYSQLRFFLKLLNITKSTREVLWADTRKAFQENTKNIQDTNKKGELLMKNLEDSREFPSKLINDSWKYIESIKILLEENPKYIRCTDWPIIDRFFKEYVVREIVTGKNKYKDTKNIFTVETTIRALDGIFSVIDEMYEKVKI